MEKELFYIHKDGFSYNESSTYKNLDINSKSILTSSENKSEDIFYFNFYNSYNDLSNINNENQKKIYKEFYMNFILMNYIVIYNSIDKKNPGEIGLQYRYANISDNIIFVKSLKERREINNYIFSFIFTNNSNIDNFTYEGYFIIGEELTDKDNEKDNIKYTKAVDRNGLIKWDIFFDEIYSYEKNNETNKKIINKNHKTQLIVDKPYIIGTEDYESFILTNFFQDLINKGICFKKFISNLYCYYCDNSSELFIFNQFPNLYFYSRELDETFVLTKKDLFLYDINYNNKDEHFCYFMIWFTKSSYLFEKKYWTLGIQFFKKYRFSFDYEKKLIGFYNQSFKFNLNDQSGIDDNRDDNNFIVKIIAIIVLFIILFFLIGIIYKKSIKNKKRKKKLNELVDEDNYEYKSNEGENIDIKNNIN